MFTKCDTHSAVACKCDGSLATMQAKEKAARLRKTSAQQQLQQRVSGGGGGSGGGSGWGSGSGGVSGGGEGAKGSGGGASAVGGGSGTAAGGGDVSTIGAGSGGKSGGDGSAAGSGSAGILSGGVKDWAHLMDPSHSPDAVWKHMGYVVTKRCEQCGGMEGESQSCVFVLTAPLPCCTNIPALPSCRYITYLFSDHLLDPDISSGGGIVVGGGQPEDISEEEEEEEGRDADGHEEGEREYY